MLATLFIIAGSSGAYSQSAPKKELNYSKHPYWIAMIDDTTANYFETIKAYDAFWKNREKPKEKSSWLKRLFQNDVEKNETMYTYQCKRYEHWKMVQEPYVQPDGSILYPYQRLQLWQNARQ